MISGIGIDIATIEEFRRLLADPATHFFAVHFTPAELAYARAHVSDDPARHLAGRYAAKEAAIKAFRGTWDVGRGTKKPATDACPPEVWRDRRPTTEAIDYREIEVVSRADGAPRLVFHGTVAERLKTMGVHHAHLSLSHEGDMAIAMVIVEQ